MKWQFDTPTAPTFPHRPIPNQPLEFVIIVRLFHFTFYDASLQNIFPYRSVLPELLRNYLYLSGLNMMEGMLTKNNG